VFVLVPLIFFLGVVFRGGGGSTSSSFSAWIRGGDQICFIFCVCLARSLIGKRVWKTALPLLFLFVY